MAIVINKALAGAPNPGATTAVDPPYERAMIGRGAYVTKSGTIVNGGTSQQVIAANAARKGLVIENPSSESESLFVEFGAAADTGGTSIELLPGGSLDQNARIVSTQSVNLNAATTGHKYIVKEM